MTASMLLAAAALLAWPAAAGRATRRLHALHPASAPAPEPSTGPATARRWLLAAAPGVAVALFLGGPAGVVAGIVAAVVADRVLRRRADDDDSRRRRDLLQDLPAACDLLAVCVTAGIPLPAALAAVAEAVPGAVGEELARVAGVRRLGADARRAWDDAPPELDPLARTVQRAETSGARAAAALSALAAEARAAQRTAADAAVRRAGVWVLAPLGACFLPAFVCLGVVPLVLGIAGEALG